MPAGARALLCAAVVAALGCNINNPGDDPPRGELYFPNAMAFSKHDPGEAPRLLFVANSDFDLRYNAGTVQAYSLERLASEVDACRSTPECEIDPGKVLEDEVWIGPFSTALGLSSDGEYLFAASRTEDNLTFIHVNASASKDAVLRCNGMEKRCSLHAVPDDDVTQDTPAKLAWPADPQLIISGPLSDWLPAASAVQGDYVLTAHAGGELASFAFDPQAKSDSDRLRMTGVMPGLAGALTRAAYDPATRLLYLTAAAAGSDKLLERVGVSVTFDPSGKPRPLPYAAGALALTGVQRASDTRDVAFIPEVAAAGGTLAQDRALVVAQAPDALLVVDANAARNPPNQARVEATTVVGAGASRLAVGLFPGHPLAAVAAFDAREISIIDLTSMLTRVVIPNLSGPLAMLIDESRRLLYVADFRSSVIRVIDLTPLLDGEVDPNVRVVATLGHPHVLQELQ